MKNTSLEQKKKIRTKITRASSWRYLEFKEFENYDKLIKYMKRVHTKWIIDFDTDKKENIDLELTIYDTWVE